MLTDSQQQLSAGGTSEGDSILTEQHQWQKAHLLPSSCPSLLSIVTLASSSTACGDCHVITVMPVLTTRDVGPEGIEPKNGGTDDHLPPISPGRYEYNSKRQTLPTQPVSSPPAPATTTAVAAERTSSESDVRRQGHENGKSNRPHEASPLSPSAPGIHRVPGHSDLSAAAPGKGKDDANVNGASPAPTPGPGPGQEGFHEKKTMTPEERASLQRESLRNANRRRSSQAKFVERQRDVNLARLTTLGTASGGVTSPEQDKQLQREIQRAEDRRRSSAQRASELSERLSLLKGGKKRFVAPQPASAVPKPKGKVFVPVPRPDFDFESPIETADEHEDGAGAAARAARAKAREAALNNRDDHDDTVKSKQKSAVCTIL